MRCGEVHEQLVHYFYGELAEDENAVIYGHLMGCRICQEELALLKLTFGALDAWQVPSSPLLDEREPAQLTPGPLYEGVTSAQRPVFEPLTSIGCGMLWALASLFLMKEYLSVNPFAPSTHLALGVLSAGLFAALCHLALWGYARAFESRLGLSLMLTARVTLLAIGLTCLTFYMFPVPWIVQNWRGGSFAPFLSQPFPIALLYLLIGVGSAIIAFLVAGIALGRKLAHNLWLHALLAACLYVAVMAPGLAVICIPFSLAIYVSMLAGSLLGGVAGGMVGLRVAASL